MGRPSPGNPPCGPKGSGEGWSPAPRSAPRPRPHSTRTVPRPPRPHRRSAAAHRQQPHEARPAVRRRVPARAPHRQGRSRPGVAVEQTLGLPVVDRRAALFIGYQVHRIVLSPTLGLSALTGFDIGIVALTWREYQRQRVYRVGPAAGPELPPVITLLECDWRTATWAPTSDPSRTTRTDAPWAMELSAAASG
jgi:hypothetical protein